MKIFLLEVRGKNTDHNSYSSVVVCAENESEAREIHPNNDVVYSDGKWFNVRFDEDDSSGWDWVASDEINSLEVTELGKANSDQPKGVVLASFNAE